MWPRLWKALVFVVVPAAIVLAVLYVIYRFIDPIPPRHFVIAAGMAGSGYDSFARQYARILARDGVEVEVRNAAGAVEDLNLLRDGASGVQAALTALGFTQPPIRTPSIRSVAYSMRRYSFFTGMPNPLRNLHNSGVSACPLARREPPYAHLCCRS
jgi:hypothetical protein